MPELSRFQGIIVRMYAEVGGPHHRPHLHAYAGQTSIVVAVDTIEVMAGTMSVRQQRLLLAWAELHQDELRRNWERLLGGAPAVPIDPLD